MNNQNKQITIYELLPLLEIGWVAMDEDKEWCWYEQKPYLRDDLNYWQNTPTGVCLPLGKIKIQPFDGDWTDSLMECGK